MLTSADRVLKRATQPSELSVLYLLGRGEEGCFSRFSESTCEVEGFCCSR